ncbi:hypothetical protein ACSBR1_018286 [Camellia fascicularis]
MKFLEDYDFELHYYPGKSNVMDDVLSRKSMSTLASIVVREWKMMSNINEFDLQLHESAKQTTKFTAIAQLTLVKRVVEAQQSDSKVETI